MKTYKYLSTLIIAFLISSLAIGQDLISAKELAGKMNDDNVVVIDTRKTKDYNKTHIKGAIHLYQGELNNDTPVKGTLKKPSELAAIFGKKGISEKNEIVLYCNKGTNAGRVYWVLKYMGAQNVKILDGQMKAWKAGRKPITKTASTRKATTFNKTLHKEYLARMSDVKKSINNASIVLIDARDLEEYNGTKEDDKDNLRKGHIPGAISIPKSNLVDSKSKLKSKDALASIFNDAGVTADKNVIIYCKSSSRAGLEFMALTSVLGYKNVKVYDGAFYEWESIAANEVVK
ncbi:MAG: sulfurtransferase [Bacteroidota bacterium]